MHGNVNVEFDFFSVRLSVVIISYEADMNSEVNNISQSDLEFNGKG
jgi:hypothetical protein